MFKKVRHFDFGTVIIEDDIVIGTMNEGIVSTVANSRQILDFIESHIKNRPFGYISYRRYSYAVDPNVYTYIVNNSLIRANALVCEKPDFNKNFAFEKHFFKYEMQSFDSIPDAKAWMKKVLCPKRKQA